MFRRITGKSIFQVSVLLVFLIGCPTTSSAQGHEISINPAKLPLYFNKSEQFMYDLNYQRMFDAEWGLRVMLSAGARKVVDAGSSNSIYTQKEWAVAGAIGLKIFPLRKNQYWRNFSSSILVQFGLVGLKEQFNQGGIYAAEITNSPMTRIGVAAAYRLPLGVSFFLEPEFGYFLGSRQEFSLKGPVERPAKYPAHFALNIGLAF